MTEKENNHLLQISFYQQAVSKSCGAACLLMVGNFFDPQKFPLKEAKEREIHQEIKYWEGDEEGEFGNVAKMIKFGRENGFKVRYFLKISPKMFMPPENFDEELWKKYIDSFFGILGGEKEKGIEIIEDCRIETLINEIMEGRPVICEVRLDKHITHFVVVQGIKDDVVHFIDPSDSNGYQKERREVFEEMMDLENGRSFFSLDQ